jgi:hypothetical protein
MAPVIEAPVRLKRAAGKSAALFSFCISRLGLLPSEFQRIRLKA